MGKVGEGMKEAQDRFDSTICVMDKLLGAKGCNKSTFVIVTCDFSHNIIVILRKCLPVIFMCYCSLFYYGNLLVISHYSTKNCIIISHYSCSIDARCIIAQKLCEYTL
jgi:hypothetical protein